ncbi:hypothetical protein [Frigoriflavimonas asaccharolytica]|uniref:DUF2007 domain-containing protein n=1 Tax=Frigoriflavimonas asaccharolytica TaxID=2735899 RepID=A0A8J8G7M3_9FLAO|nr:hypothetical protein [Frigoriflavimonas asaccharolytica]NRS92786.1 hypothetical protein [Frigoriflavimonas asaccharolytica]
MNSEFITFRTFHDDESLTFFKKFLENQDIPFIVENHSQRFDPSFAYNSFNKEYSVKIAAENFEKIYSLEEKDVEMQLENIPKDYYLLDYSIEDLQKITSARDEWNAFDYLLAKRLLKEKNAFSEEITDDKKLKNRVENLKNVSGIKTIWLILFYIIAFFGGFFAIFIGYYIKVAKKNLPNGETISKFTKRDVLHGNILFFAGIFFLVFWIVRGYYFFPFLHFKY